MIKKELVKAYINESPNLCPESINIHVLLSGQQKLSKQRKLVMTQDDLDYLFCDVSQHSSPGGKEKRLWLQDWRLQNLNDMAILLVRLTWLLPLLTLQYCQFEQWSYT